MARPIHKLSDPKCKSAKSGRHADGGGLFLMVGGEGRHRTASWLFLWKVDGHRREMGLGSFRSVPLAVARDLAKAAREDVAAGRDPIAARNARRAGNISFGEAADKYIEEMEPSWRNAKHRYQWRETLKTYAAPLRPTPVSQITTDRVLAVLKPLWLTKSETAIRLRGRIERVLDWAKAKHHRSGENPAAWKGNLKELLPLLPAKRKRVKHHPAMPFADVPAFMGKLQKQMGIAARALEFCILTAARSGEVAGAKWSEIDFAAKTWTVPGERMKAGLLHRVPLSGRAVAILREMEKLRTSEFVFPGAKDSRPLSDMALTQLLRRMGLDVTTHGFRSSFRDWAGDRTAFPREVAEAALAHLVGDEVERAYRRGDALEKRRKLMVAWADHCEPKAGNVIAIRRRAR